MTGPPPAPEPGGAGGPALEAWRDPELDVDPRQGPPAGHIFSLEARPAPGLYLVAWLLAVGGTALAFIAFFTSSQIASVLLLAGGLVLIVLGLSAAAGYQLVSRARRSHPAYRGPSPAILLGISVAVTTAFVLIVAPVRLLELETPVGFLLGLLVVALAYASTVALFVVRAGALRWAEMGWPAWPGRRDVASVAGDAATAIAVMVPANVIVTIAAGVVALQLDVRPSSVLPATRTELDWALIAIGAVVVAPLGEEIFFRGFALTAWQRDLGRRAALIRSALFFALVHILNVTSSTAREGLLLAVLTFASILPLGLLLGWLFQRRGLLAAFAGHAASNGSAVLIAALAEGAAR